MKPQYILAAATAACLLGMMAGCTGGGDASRDTDAQITSGGNLSAFSMYIGDCLISANLDDQFSEVPAVPCTEPHDSEVMYIFDMPDGDYDEDAIEAAGDDQCAQEIAEYVGPNYDTVSSEGLEWSYFTPTSESWDNGDREVDCIAFTVSSENELTSSVKGLGA